MTSRRTCRVIAALVLWLAGCSEATDHHVWRATPPPPTIAQTELSAWTIVNEVSDWQANMLLESAAALNAAGGAVSLTVEGDAVDNNVYRSRITSAAAHGTAPDIVFVEHYIHFQGLIDAGYVQPLDDCRQSHPALTGIRDEVWELVMYRGRLWAIPASLNTRHLFYNKEMLRALGWTEERIDALPADIRNGRFTFDDLMRTATEAIDAGVVAPGYGYWHYLGNRVHYYYNAMGGLSYDPASGRLMIERQHLANAYRLLQKLVDDRITLLIVLVSSRNTWSGRLAWHDAVVQGRVLFWLARSADWPRWEMGTMKPEELLNRFGYALFPSAVPGRAGAADYIWTGFAIMSEQATGRSNQAAACELLVQLASPPSAAYAMTSGHFPVLGVDLPIGASPRETYVSRSQYITDYALHYPPRNDPRFEEYLVLLTNNADQVLLGNLTVDEAVAAAVEAAQAEFGDDLIIK